MLQIVIPASEGWDEKRQEFVNIKEQRLQLEHSLISLSKWESKWQKPFLSSNDKTSEEIIDYIRCMTLNQHVDPDIYYGLTEENMRKINEYIESPMTATTFNNFSNNQGGHEIFTSEVIYYWMIAQGIPFECQKWHLNRLLTLIRVCNVKNSPPKKMSRAELSRHYAHLNAQRKKKMQTKG